MGFCRIYTSLQLLIFFVYFQLTSSYSFSGKNSYFSPSNILSLGNQLLDLQGSGSTFMNDASSWSASSLVNAGVKVSVCDETYLLGGYNILGGSSGESFSRTYSGLPLHNQIDLNFTFFPIDSWDGHQGDHFDIAVDSYSISAWNFRAHGVFVVDICGESRFGEHPPIYVRMTVPHSSSSVTLRIISQLDQATDDESFGFRDISMIFRTVTPPNSSICGVTSDLALSRDWCTCSSEEYMSPDQSGHCFSCDSTCKTCDGGFNYNCMSCPNGRYLSNGQCLLCHSDCATCSGGSSTQCLTCSTGRFMVNGNSCYPDCNSPLNQTVIGVNTHCGTPCPGQYVLWDGTCLGSCNNYLTPVVYNTFDICNYTCADNQYLYWDGSCGDTCYFPLIIRSFHGKYYCDYPCNSSQYLYWNNTCLGSCTLPLQIRTDKGMNHCDYPCSGTQYLYWNGSCLPSCITPLSARINNGNRFCDNKCSQTSQYLYWDSTCSSSCPAPLVARTEGTSMTTLLCIYPCNSNEYLYWNGTCAAACSPPLSVTTTKGKNYCQYPCNTNLNEYLFWNGTCMPSCPSPLVTRVEASRNYCDYPCTNSQYLYWNGSCIESCLSPLILRVIDGNNYCDYPCQSSEYLYWDTSCNLTCSFPLSSRIEASKKYCDYPCLDAEYLYWNGTCFQSCSLPLTGNFIAGKNICEYPCSSANYLYWDGSCSDQCSAPLVPISEGNPLVRNFCSFPCNSSEYLDPNGTCTASCNLPYSARIQNGRNFCSIPCDSGEFLYWNGSCMATCEFPLAQRIEMTGTYCDYPCQTQEYLYWNGTCKSNCNTPLTATLVKGNNYCSYPCTSSDYLYWDGSCSNQCSFPLIPVSEGSPTVQNFCLFGSCLSNQYLYWNGTCSNTCDYPLSMTTQNGRSFCSYPCSPGQYLYWNASCLSSCPLPHVSRIESSLKYCDYPCKGAEFLYSNGSCIAGCNPPLISRLESGKKYCDYPCPLSQYLYWNSSCISSCAFPLLSRTEGTLNFCNYVCPAGYYLYWNGSCIADCNAPLKIRIDASDKYCDYPCQSNQIAYWDGSCSSGCPAPFATRAEGNPSTMNFCIFPCSNSGDFLYWNGTCSSTCPSPLTTRSQNGRSICDYPCSSDMFLYWNGSCLASCNNPLSTYMEAGKKYCKYPCSSLDYLYWNGTCSSQCDLPLSQYTVGTNKFCEFRCNSNEYLYWDGTCSPQCPFPLTQTTEGSSVFRKFCQYTCNPTDYLYWNGTCATGCASPLVTESINNRKICKYPCDLNKYLYWEGSCLSSCTAPLIPKTEAGVRFCTYPCEPTKYLYWDGSCALACNTTFFKPKNEKGVYFCDFPCGANAYLYWNQSCLPGCPSPFIVKSEGTTITREFCTFPCADNELVNWNNSCVTSCSYPYRTKISNAGRYCNLPCDDPADFYYEELGLCKKDCLHPNTIVNNQSYLQCVSSNDSIIPTDKEKGGIISALFEAPLNSSKFTLIKVIKAMQYLRYLDIKLPPRLERLGLSKGASLNSINSPSRLLNQLAGTVITKSSLPSVFSKHNLGSTFISNLSVTLIVFACIVITAIFFTIFEKIALFKKIEIAQAIFRRLRIYTRWNLGIMVLATSIDDYILYTSVEFRTLDLSSGAPFSHYISFILCLVFILVELGLLIGAYWLVKQKCSMRNLVVPNSHKTMSNFDDKWQDYQIIYKGFRDNNTLNPFFFLIYVIRIGFPMLITVCAIEVPILVIVVQLVTSMLIVGYIILKKPFKKRINHIQLLIYEISIFLMNICIFILACIDIGNDNFSIVLGDIVILGNEVLNLLTFVFLGIRCLKEVFSIIKYLKKRHTKKMSDHTAWLRLLGVAFQQMGFGFEELNEDLMSSTDTALTEGSLKMTKTNNDINITTLNASKPNETYTQRELTVENRSGVSGFESKIFTNDMNASKEELFVSSVNRDHKTAAWGNNKQKKSSFKQKGVVPQKIKASNNTLSSSKNKNDHLSISKEESMLKKDTDSKMLKSFEWKNPDVSGISVNLSVLDNSNIEKRDLISEFDLTKDRVPRNPVILEEKHHQEEDEGEKSREIRINDLVTEKRQIRNLKARQERKNPSSLLQNILTLGFSSSNKSPESKASLSNTLNTRRQKEKVPVIAGNKTKEKIQPDISVNGINLNTREQEQAEEEVLQSQAANYFIKETNDVKGARFRKNHESRHISKFDEPEALASTERGLLRESQLVVQDKSYALNSSANPVETEFAKAESKDFDRNTKVKEFTRKAEYPLISNKKVIGEPSKKNLPNFEWKSMEEGIVDDYSLKDRKDSI